MESLTNQITYGLDYNGFCLRETLFLSFCTKCLRGYPVKSLGHWPCNDSDEKKCAYFLLTDPKSLKTLSEINLRIDLDFKQQIVKGGDFTKRILGVRNNKWLLELNMKILLER